MTAVAQCFPRGALTNLSSMTSVAADYALNAAGYAGGVAAGFVDGFVIRVKDGIAMASSKTPSVIEQDRFQKPMSALVDAAIDQADIALESSDHVVPSGETYLEAIKLLRMLPANVEAPEPVIEPSGAIAWMWSRDTGDFLVLAVNGKGRVQRSAVLDGRESHGATILSDRLTHAEFALLASFPSSHA